MKQRILTSVVGLALLAGVLYGYATPVFPAVLAILSGLAVYEILVPTRLLCPASLGAVLGLFACGSFFLLVYFEEMYMPAILVLTAVLILLTLRFHQRYSFQKFSTCIFTVIAIPLAFYTVTRLDGVVSVILVCVAAWVADAGAYFVGNRWGRKKLAPKISPNKTVEGAIGGLISAGIAFPAVCWAYIHWFQPAMGFSLPRAVLIGCVCSVAGMIGDLFASMIKRQSGIKDFGNIMPGHGGIMDRFDSFLFAAPVLYFLTRFAPIFGN